MYVHENTGSVHVQERSGQVKGYMYLKCWPLLPRVQARLHLKGVQMCGA